MICHQRLTSRRLHHDIAAGRITLAGNAKLKIFGLLSCASGKRMLRKNRVFFRDWEEAMGAGYRPCGHCLRPAYLRWCETQGRDA
jgi:methylphosphotriester-DNA--protein-cysteine methyltransferase